MTLKRLLETLKRFRASGLEVTSFGQQVGQQLGIKLSTTNVDL